MRLPARYRLAGFGALVALLLTTSPVGAAWSASTVDDSWFLTRPSLQVDSADHSGIAYTRLGKDPGIFYTTNATGSWVSTRVTSAGDVVPALRFDASDHAHVVFARRTGTAGIYVTDNSTGGWATASLVAADLDPSWPSLAINGSGDIGIAYTSNYSFAPGLYFLTNSTGGWVKTRLTSATWDGMTSLQFDGVGHAHIMFVRYAPENPGVYYATNATGSWVTTRLTTSFDDNASFVFDGAGKIHATFRRFASGNEATFYATNATGSWVISQLPHGPSASFNSPVIALDPSGAPHIFATIYDAAAPNPGGHLFHYVLSNGSWVGSSDVPDDDPVRSDDFPSLGFLSNGTMQLTFRRLFQSAGLRFLAFASTSSVIEGSSLDNAASVDLAPSGTRDIAFNRRVGNTGETVFASGSGGGWTLDTAGTGTPALYATDIAADSSGAVRIVDGGGYYSNATLSWVSDAAQPFGAESEVEVDGSGHAHVIYSYPTYPYWQIDYRSDATGSWANDTPSPGNAFDADLEPSLALDGASKPHIAWVSPNVASGALVYQNRISGSWTSTATIAPGPNAWPSIGVDAAGKVHIAYIHYGTSPGIYYATNKTGAWVTTRLTRSYAEGPPSLAIDGSGHIYVATTRASWAADPGVYVMTNATGSWVVARVVATESAGDVSLTVTSGGLARMVFVTDQGVIEYENSSTTVTIATNGALTTVLRSQLALAATKNGPRSDGISPTDPTRTSTGSTTAPLVRLGGADRP